MPLLNTPNNIHTQLSILLQRVLPMRRNSIRQRKISRNGIHHHLAHFVVFGGVGVDILHAAETGVGLRVVVEGADGFDDVFAEFVDLEG